MGAIGSFSSSFAPASCKDRSASQCFGFAGQVKRVKAALSVKRLDCPIINEKPGDLSRKDESEWETESLDAVSYIKLSFADDRRCSSHQKTTRK
ncbi:hypothetical protein TNCV_745571 [Trichonephila clavipes]|nr:hypothetical protein TNCV_745571 [Trichonephila clavipes]